jgi:flagellum-specific ATP synthase
VNAPFSFAALERADFAEYAGFITRIAEGYLEADGPMAQVGDFCAIEGTLRGSQILAEVVSADTAKIRLLPLEHSRLIAMGAKITRADAYNGVAVGNAYKGRVINALGNAIDGHGEITSRSSWPREGKIPKTLDRVSAREKLPTGIRAIDGLLPIGKGQRIGIFAASGVGKTSLVEQLSRQVSADHMIMCLVGERGREVEKLWSMHLQGDQRDKFTIVAATSDESASMRVRAVDQALGLAEYWRGAGAHVVLFIDSITRLALALRELGLAAGEPPTVRAFTPNVFAAMPRFVERCGAVRGSGSITAILTVLSETDDVDDPIVELMKSLLDGHIVLSRQLADKGHFPAIDISASVSRMASDLFDQSENALARAAHRSFAEYTEARPMIESGIYTSGSNERIDQAIRRFPQLCEFLQQNMDDYCEADATHQKLAAIFSEERSYG